MHRYFLKTFILAYFCRCFATNFIHALERGIFCTHW